MASVSTLFSKLGAKVQTEKEEKTRSNIKDVFKKLRTYLRILGLYCDLCGMSRESLKTPWPVNTVITVTSGMSLFYLVSVWFVQLRLVPIFFKVEIFSTGFMQVALLFFMYLSALWNFTSAIYHIQKHWHPITKGLKSECSLEYEEFPFIFRHFGRFLIVLFTLVCAIPMSSLLALFRPEGPQPPSEMTLFRLYPAQPKTTFWLLMKYFYAYFAFLSYQQAFAYCIFVITVCYFIKREFETVTNDLKREISGDSLEPLRQKHERLCHLTENADKMIGYLVFGIYFTGILNVCFCVSCLSSDLFPRSQIPTLLSVTVAAGAQMTACTAVGVSLNHQAHKPKGILLKFKAGELKREDFQSLTVFLAQVSGQDIGITALGLFTINKSTILTVAGTVITYAVVVQQLNVGSGLISPLVNGTLGAP